MNLSTPPGVAGGDKRLFSHETAYEAVESVSPDPRANAILPVFQRPEVRRHGF